MSSKERLFELEQTGNHLFHGSPDGDIETLEPRQGNHVPDLNKPTETIPDGMPAVSATPYADMATFKAIINKKNVPISHTSGFGTSPSGEKQFRVSSEEVLEHAKDKKGYVYVFDKNEFEPYSRNGGANEYSMEWRSYNSVRPVDVIEVTSDDLPHVSDIQIG